MERAQILRTGIGWFAVLGVLVQGAWAQSSESWLCTEGVATLRKGDSILACGIGIGASEPEARLKALDYAKAEFERICSMSSDCRGREVVLIPGRNTCETQGEEQVRCYRGITFEIAKSGTGGGANPDYEIAFLNERIKLREQELEVARNAFEKRQKLKELDRQISAMNRDEPDAVTTQKEPLAPHEQFFNLGLEAGGLPLPVELVGVDSPVMVSLYFEFRPLRWLGLRAGVHNVANGYEVSDFYYDEGGAFTGSGYSLGIPFYFNISGIKDESHLFIMPEWGSLDWELTLNSGQYLSSYSSYYQLYTFTGEQNYRALSLGFEYRPKTGLGYSIRAGVQSFEEIGLVEGETGSFVGLSLFLCF